MADSQIPDDPAKPSPPPGPRAPGAAPAPQKKYTEAFDFEAIHAEDPPSPANPPAGKSVLPTPDAGPVAKVPGAQRAATPTPPPIKRVPTTGSPTPTFDFNTVTLRGDAPAPPTPGPPRPAASSPSRKITADDIPVVDVDDASPSPTGAFQRTPTGSFVKAPGAQPQKPPSGTFPAAKPPGAQPARPPSGEFPAARPPGAQSPKPPSGAFPAAKAPGAPRPAGNPATPPPRAAIIPGAAELAFGTPAPGSTPPASRTPTPGAMPAAGRTPTPGPMPAGGGHPTPVTRIPTSGVVTPGNLPKQENPDIELEDDWTTQRRTGVPPAPKPPTAPPASAPQPSSGPFHEEEDAPVDNTPLEIQGETKRVKKPKPEEQAAAAAPPVPETPPGHPNIDFDRILIIRLSALGDCVHVLPSFANLRRAFPRAKIAWAIEDRFASLVDGLPGLDEVLVFPRREFRGVLFKPWLWLSALGRARGIKKALRKFNPTVAFDFQGNLKSGLHARLSQAPARIGLADAKEGAERNYNWRVKLDGNVHRVERGFELLRAAQVPISTQHLSPAIQERDRAAIDGWLTYKHAKKTVVCHIGTSSFGAIKRWPIEKWAKTGELLARGGQRTVLFAWGPGERELAEKAASLVPDGHAHAGPDTPRIGTLAALIKKSALFIGCDSGPLHLAAMMNAPVVGLYGPKDPAVYGPWCDNHVVVFKGLACSPCNKRDCDITDCMNMIEPAEVAAAAEELLAKIKSPAALTEESGKKTLWASGEERWDVGKEEVQ